MMNLTLVGDLIKAPTLNEKINVPGKQAFDFTFVQKTGKDNSKTQWWNITMFFSSEAQIGLIGKLQKGAVLQFTDVKVSNVLVKEDGITTNIYCNANNFSIIGSLGGTTETETSGSGKPSQPNKTARQMPMPLDTDEDPFA